MKNSVKKELASHVLDCINDGVIDNTNSDEWHHLCFNDDYYIIGYWHCSEWLKRHDIDVFEAISTCQEYEKDNFGECTKIYDNSETTVNMLVYVYGEELLNEVDSYKLSLKKLKKAMEAIVND